MNQYEVPNFAKRVYYDVWYDDTHDSLQLVVAMPNARIEALMNQWVYLGPLS